MSEEFSRMIAPHWCAAARLFECEGVVGSIYTGKIPHQASGAAEWQPRDRLNRIARYIASGR